MRVNYISGNTIIGEIYDEFNVKSDDWVARTPNWIYKGLRYLNNQNTYANIYITGNVVNNRIVLPDYDGKIKLLTIDGVVLMNPDKLYIPTFANTINTTDTTVVSTDDTFNANNALSNDEHLIDNSINTSTDRTTSQPSYYIEKNIVYVTYTTGTYKLWYKTIPITFDDKLQMFVPNIPDIEKVIANIKWFVFKNILSRGLIHPIYSLGNRNPELDPNIKWRTTLLGAKIALSAMDVHDRNEIANINMAFFNLPSYQTGQVENLFELFSRDEI